VKRGSQRRKVSEVRGKIAYWEKGIPIAAIARHSGAGMSAIAMAISRIEAGE